MISIYKMLGHFCTLIRDCTFKL
uniref:Uncharacterized protein n=1 Tax=Anguilla anguilla TaxID=7936 RepID=A0A0E9Q8G5_ANGAN